MWDGGYAQSLKLLGPDAAPDLRRLAALSALLPCLADHDHAILRRWYGTIAPTKIVALPWHPGRLAESRRRRAAGTRPPLVHVLRVRLPSQVWYLVTDGMHRAWAAREAGATRLGARVDGTVICTPEHFCLSLNRGTWELYQRVSPSQGTYIRDVHPDWLPTADWLGVARV